MRNLAFLGWAIGDVSAVVLRPALDLRDTGDYQVGGEDFHAATDADHYISYADYAVGMLDIIEQGTYIRQRIVLTHGR